VKLALTEASPSLELKDCAVLFPMAYNNDNFIYRPGRSWRYKISLAENNQLKVLEVNRKGDWRLSPANGKISRQWKRVNELVLDVVDGYGPYDADHNETVIKYSYRMNGNDDGNESFTGLVENDANVWIHPLRKDYFEILALNPYPFIKHPVRVGQRFNFKIPIPESWSNPEWQKWYGTLNNNCRYEIVKQRSVTLPFGDISPFAVMSNCDNELGSTGLIAYYDEAMGFVKMDYRNIDGSWLSLELIEPPF